MISFEVVHPEQPPCPFCGEQRLSVLDYLAPFNDHVLKRVWKCDCIGGLFPYTAETLARKPLVECDAFDFVSNYLGVDTVRVRL